MLYLFVIYVSGCLGLKKKKSCSCIQSGLLPELNSVFTLSRRFRQRQDELLCLLRFNLKNPRNIRRPFLFRLSLGTSCERRFDLLIRFAIYFLKETRGFLVYKNPAYPQKYPKNKHFQPVSLHLNKVEGDYWKLFRHSCKCEWISINFRNTWDTSGIRNE